MLRVFQNPRALGQPRPSGFTGVGSISFQAFGSEPIPGGEGVSIKPEDQSALLLRLPSLPHLYSAYSRRWSAPEALGWAVGDLNPVGRQGQGSVGRPCGRELVGEEEGADADSWERLLDLQPRSQR